MKNHGNIIVILIAICISSCSLLQRSNLDKIKRYEYKTRKQYSNSVYSEILYSEGLDVILEERNDFPYSLGISINLHDTVNIDSKFNLDYYYKQPNGKVNSFSYNSNFSQLHSTTGGVHLSSVRGYGVRIDDYLKNGDEIEVGIYEYHEKFTMGTASYELICRFYYDPKTMIDVAGSPRNNGYWMN